MLHCNIINESGLESMFFATVDAAPQAHYAPSSQRHGAIIANAKKAAKAAYV